MFLGTWLQLTDERRPLTRLQAVRKIAPTATMIGQALGHYRIVEQIGAGGPRDVYNDEELWPVRGSSRRALRAVSTSVRQPVSEFTEAPPRARSGKGPGRREAVAVCL